MREPDDRLVLPALAEPELPAPRARGERRARPRSRTIPPRRITREELRQGALLYPVDDEQRPRTRGECQSELRPCPWVACKFHLYLEVNEETGALKFNFPDLEPWELAQTCALDVADRGGATLDQTGQLINLTKERVRQVEVRGLLKLKMASPSPDEPGACPANHRAVIHTRATRTPGR